jgi:hypothetical protein
MKGTTEKMNFSGTQRGTTASGWRRRERMASVLAISTGTKLLGLQLLLAMSPGELLRVDTR